MHDPEYIWTDDIILCGHVHEKWLRKDNKINVGVDQWDFKPITLEQILSVKGV
jgi:calcineurin-like phosphoesterase family protein